ncbi:hypothetical protein GP2143_03833 [marine gamma proteobacterium HTCC2143]|jgi:hypothetical protein|uniref:Uncharacterized protein n=1 Tax=marine gamma proteobacterium HTCC2143 TaxID=247633 RepID=A0YDB8_9GAMM|nr:hypothetical protein GP2143_03833 [marine gamma proteobacterium HTCC2143]
MNRLRIAVRSAVENHRAVSWLNVGDEIDVAGFEFFRMLNQEF